MYCRERQDRRQKALDHNTRSRVETSIGRYKQALGIRFRKEERCAIAIAIHVLNACWSSDARSPSASMCKDKAGDAATQLSMRATTAHKYSQIMVGNQCESVQDLGERKVRGVVGL